MDGLPYCIQETIHGRIAGAYGMYEVEVEVLCYLFSAKLLVYAFVGKKIASFGVLVRHQLIFREIYQQKYHACVLA